MPNRSGDSSTRSGPSDCTSKICSMVSGLQQPHAVGRAAQRNRRQDAAASDRALPWPLAPPMSAARQPRSRDRGDFRRAGSSVNVLSVVVGQSVERQVQRSAAGMSSAMRSVVLVRGADLEVGTERARDLVADELLERFAGDPAEHLADQVAVGEGVIARRGARLPPRRLSARGGRSTSPSRRCPRCANGGSHPESPERVRQQVAKLDVLLAVCGELRPVLGDRREWHRPGRGRSSINARQRGERLGAREDVDDGVLAPRHRLGGIRVAAPHVDDEFAVDVDGYRGADFLAVGDLVGECLGDLVEPGIAVPLQNVMHRTIMRRRAAQIAFGHSGQLPKLAG